MPTIGHAVWNIPNIRYIERKKKKAKFRLYNSPTDGKTLHPHTPHHIASYNLAVTKKTMVLDIKSVPLCKPSP